MKKWQKSVLVFVLLICIYCNLTGFKYNSDIKLTLQADQSIVYDKIISEDLSHRNFFEKIFNIKRSKIALKYKEKNISDDEIIKLFFPDLVKEIESLAIKTYIPPTEAEVKFLPNDKNMFKFVDEKTGKRLNTQLIYNELLNQIDNKNINIVDVFETIYPNITKDELQINTVLRGTFKTYYGSSSISRKNNINRAVSLINGRTVLPNEEFSFNDIVGPRTVVRGFKEAPIISNGKFVKGVGGGVCQVSTTLYNSVLYADLQVLSVSRHTLPVSYVPASFDAMVSSATDFKFKNSTSNNIYIKAMADNQYLSISIYGEPMEYKIQLISDKICVIPFEVEYLNDKNTEKGVEEVISSGKNGLESKGYIRYIKDDKIISQKLIRHDKYASQKRVIMRGTKEITNNENNEINRIDNLIL